MEIENLSQNRDKLLGQIEKYFISHNNNFLRFLGGSLAKGNPDEFSDIDFRVVISDDFEKKDVLDNFIDYFDSQISFIETSTSFYGVFHFRNFIKVDIFIYFQKELSPNVWLKDIKILKDNQEFLKDLKMVSELKEYIFKEQYLVGYLNKYTAYLHELYRRYKREELNYCEHCTLMMKHILISLWVVKSGNTPNDLGDWSKYEGERTLLNKEQKLFISMYTPVDLNELDIFVESASNEVIKVAESIVSQLDFKIDLNKYDELFNMKFTF